MDLKCSLKSTVWPGDHIGSQCEWHFIREKSSEVFCLRWKRHHSRWLALHATGQCSSCVYFKGVWLWFCQVQLPLSTVPLTTAYCLQNGNLFSMTVLLGWEKPESGPMCVLQPCEFRGTSVRFVFCLLRSEIFFLIIIFFFGSNKSWELD